MAAWSASELVLFYDSSGPTFWYFAPTELICTPTNSSAIAKNQIRQESESGELKILQLDSNTRETWTMRPRMMPFANRTVGAFTISGFSALKSLLVNTLNMQESTIQFAPPGTTSLSTVRYMAADFPEVPVVRLNGPTWSTAKAYHGDGSAALNFREEI